MIRARWQEHVLTPAFPLGTSKGTLQARAVWYLLLWRSDAPDIIGIGEAAPFPGHSLETAAEVRRALTALCNDTSNWQARIAMDLRSIPCVRFAAEQALQDLATGGQRLPYPSAFTRGEAGIPINGLVWMGDQATMRQRIAQQIAGGNRCIKLKIGAIGIQQELALLREVRNVFPAEELTLRVDANGAFTVEEASVILPQLAELEVESIEQPIAAGQAQAMAALCAHTPVPIALDEELIGHNAPGAQAALLDRIRPQSIVLKPSLVGGWAATRSWIDAAQERGIGWWITSALESSIGLNAIAQWSATLPLDRPQGLGTGRVYTDNIPSPLYMERGALHYAPSEEWNLARIFPAP